MKVVRRELTLQSSAYSREWDVKRGIGCHLAPIVRRIAIAAKWTKTQNDLSEEMLEKFRLSGFLWEHVMSVEDRLEHAMSREFALAELRHRQGIMFPGELYFCVNCEDTISGGRSAEEHALSRSHTGIFFNIDYLNDERQRVGEMKWTRKSSGKNCSETSLDVREWIAQNQFYCRGVGWSAGEFRTCWENGDYSFPMIPKLYEFDVDYDERELDRNWNLCISTARALEWV